jgi:Zn-finger protein
VTALDLLARGYKPINLGACPFTHCRNCNASRWFSWFQKATPVMPTTVTACDTCKQVPADEARRVENEITVYVRDERRDLERAEMARIQRELK